VRQRLRKRHKLETFPYGNFRNQEPDSLTQGWETYDPFPRYGTNALGMTGRMAILSEAYSNDPFSRRIEATYLFVREILSLVAEERVAVKRVVASSAGWRPDSVTIQSVLAAPVEQEVIAEITEADGGGSHGFARRRRTGVFKTIRMPVFDRFAARQKVARPAAYLLPPQHAHLVALLRAQGVVVGRLTAPWNGTAEAFAVDSIAVARYVFEGHRTVSVTGAWHEREASADPGWFVVSTDQRLGVLASYLLEPGSEDGFTTWNLLDRELRRGSDAPVLRVRSPILTPTILVE
jgi:dipeptidyl-peptidase-4